ncbi:hypothetical protein T5B8_12071 [Salinisphaera sp. T5B8]|uniref:MBL fold metallo-hydrolase n=1 Tax=Salinisphaera sp. T5B8 TaxID=1304154 RepID=UPI00333FBB82
MRERFLHRLWAVALLSLVGLLPVNVFAQNAAGTDVELLLLGTKGGPALLTPKRISQSSALIVDDEIVMIDAGYGASLRLAEAGHSLKHLRSIFITHLHSDHVLDYPALIMNAWATGLKQPVDVYGPAGMQTMTDQVWKMFAVDIDKRVADEGRPDPRKLVSVHEIDAGPVVDATMKVSALRVPHPPFGDGEAFAYRFQVAGKTIVFTGDLHAFPDGFAAFARNADIMVSEMVNADAVQALSQRIGNGDTLAKAILSHHVTGAQVGRAAQAAHVKKLVLSHLVPADDPSVTEQSWIDAVRGDYDGPVVVGRDGMGIHVAGAQAKAGSE